MRIVRSSGIGVTALVVSCVAGDASALAAQIPLPLNDLPDPYQSVDRWAKLPDARQWGSTAGVDIDPDGVHLWAIDRCGGNSCATSDLDPIVKFDPNGNAVTSFGSGLMLFPHGIHVDRDGNVWVTDAGSPSGSDRSQGGKGHAVFKFSPDGDLLLTLGTLGVAGDGTDARLETPCDVVTDLAGNIYVGDGHNGQETDAPPNAVSRIVKFDRDGNYVTHWGGLGSAPGQMRTPHAVDIDSQNRLIVGDRGNNRLQIFELDGTYIGELRQFSRPSGIYITDDDIIYVSDSESEFPDSQNPGWDVGIRVGSLRDGIVDYLIRGTVPAYPEGSDPEGVAVDALGNVYGAVVSGGGAVIRSARR